MRKAIGILLISAFLFSLVVMANPVPAANGAYVENYLGLGPLEAEQGDTLVVKTHEVWIPGPPYWWVMYAVTNGTFTVDIEDSNGVPVLTVTGNASKPDGVYMAEINTGQLAVGVYNYTATVQYTTNVTVTISHEEQLVINLPSLWIMIPGAVGVIAVIGVVSFFVIRRTRQTSGE